MNKILLPIFAVLILSIGVPSVFATHQDDPNNCPAGTSPATGFTLCNPNTFVDISDGFAGCTCDDQSDSLCTPYGIVNPNTFDSCSIGTLRFVALPYTPDTLAESCQDNAILDPATNHCVPDLEAVCGDQTFISGLQCLGLGLMAVGGFGLEIDTWALFAASIGTNPVITGLVALTMVGVAGQAAWFIHKRRK